MASPANSKAPSSAELAGQFDRIVGEELSGHLATLFHNVALNLKGLIQEDHFAQIQRDLNKFLFNPGYQEMGVKLANGGNDVMVREDASRSTNTTFPNVEAPGDMDVVGQFFPTRIENASKGQSNVNEFNGFVGMGGMPPLELMVKKLRGLIVCGSDKGKAARYPSEMAENLLTAMKLILPNGNALASLLINLDTVELDYTLCPTKAGLLASVKAEMNMANLAKEYPAMANLLKHLADMEIAIIDIHKPGQAPEQDVHTARAMMQIRIMYIRGAVELHVNMMLASDGSDKLMWFDRAKKQCWVDDQNRPQAVDFEEKAVGYTKSFRVVIDGTFRIPQLGCGSIALPLLVAHLRVTSTKNKFPTLYADIGETPAHRFDITILHMTDKRLTAILLRPFFNLDLLRFILLHHFHVQMEILPPITPTALSIPARDAEFPYHDDFDEFFDALQGDLDIDGSPKLTPMVLTPRRQWLFTSKVHMFLPIPPKIITSCLSLFVGEQLSSPDDVRLMIDLMTALGGDLALMHGRLKGQLMLDAAPVIMAKAANETTAESAKPLKKAKSDKKLKKGRSFFRWFKFW